MNDEELKKLAVDIIEGRVFTALNVHDEDESLIPMIFMPIALGDPSLIPEDTGLIYQYMSEQAPRSVNGYPTFFSMRLLNVDSTTKLLGIIKKYQAMKESFLD